VLGVVLAGYALRFLRWERYRRLLGVDLAPWASARIFLSGLALTVTPGKLGEAFKSVLVKEATGAPVARTAPVVFAERLTDLIGLLLLIAVAGVGSSDHAPYYVAALVAVVALLVVVSTPPLARASIVFVESLPGGGAIGPAARDAFDSTRALLTPRELPLAVGLSTVAWGLECLAFHWVLGAFGVADVGFLPGVTLFAGPLVIGAVVIFTPGGLGATEASMTGLLVAEGLTRPLAVAITFVTRLCTLWFAMGVGLVALVVHRALRRRALRRRAPGRRAGDQRSA
jgi:uncharacterized membrane protein YbhN (UPF0104 family)